MTESDLNPAPKPKKKFPKPQEDCTREGGDTGENTKAKEEKNSPKGLESPSSISEESDFEDIGRKETDEHHAELAVNGNRTPNESVDLKPKSALKSGKRTSPATGGEESTSAKKKVRFAEPPPKTFADWVSLVLIDVVKELKVFF